MARLRKPAQDEPAIFMPPSETKTTRSSPRKATRDLRYTSSTEDENPLLVPKASRRDLRYTLETEHSFLVPKTPVANDALTPRKQRILRPVQSNSRLLRKLSEESLASPEKRQRDRRVRSGTMDTDVGKRGRLMYAKSLAKSVVKKQAMKGTGKIEVVESVEVEEKEVEESVEVEQDVDVEMTEELETSFLCGDEEDVKQEEAEQQLDEDVNDEDEDDEPVMNVRARRQQPRSRYVISDSESEESESPDDDREEYTRPAFSQSPERMDFSSDDERPVTSSLSPSRKEYSMVPNSKNEIIDLTNSPDSHTTFDPPKQVRVRTASLVSSRPTTSSSNGANAILTYIPTPTKLHSPCKAPPISRPSTPQILPPSPSKLVSPSKKRPVIPKADHLHGRPSLDAYWNPEAVNEWTDAHAPSQPPVSPRKQKWRDDIVKMMEGIGLDDSSENEAYTTPPTSPKKKAPTTTSKSKSPVKKPLDTDAETTKALRAQRKDFATRKHSLAESFLIELDDTLCSGQISSAAASTGGIKLIWSKTLKTTAGRATWRRETLRIRDPDALPPHNTTPCIRHHCAIELAEKVIDEPERLYNVLAHEFCHLATFIISGVRNQPHGKEFQTWGRKASQAFADKGVVVTTKHSYEIEYKFVWECVSCGYEFKRHSRSVDPGKHSCGKCRGRLVQTKPTPRGMGGKAAATAEGAGGTQSGGMAGLNVAGKPAPPPAPKSDYQIFVKQNFARIKADLLAKGEIGQMGKVMEAVGREYREMKAKKDDTLQVKKKAEVVDLDDVESAFDGLRI